MTVLNKAVRLFVWSAHFQYGVGFASAAFATVFYVGGNLVYFMYIQDISLDAGIIALCLVEPLLFILIAGITKSPLVASNEIE